MKLSHLITTTAVLVSLSYTSLACVTMCFDASDVKSSVNCAVNKIDTLTKSQQDCLAIGGTVSKNYSD